VDGPRAGLVVVDAHADVEVDAEVDAQVLKL